MFSVGTLASWRFTRGLAFLRREREGSLSLSD
jgi:hypothetical protein